MTVDADIYHRCQDLLFRLWNALDHRRIDDIMSCLTVDARWQRERWYEGASAIRAALLARPDDLVIRHAFTNLIVDADVSGFKARMLLLAQMATRADQSQPFKASPLAIMADLRVTITQVGDDLKVSEISFDPVFQMAGG